MESVVQLERSLIEFFVGGYLIGVCCPFYSGGQSGGRLGQLGSAQSSGGLTGVEGPVGPLASVGPVRRRSDRQRSLAEIPLRTRKVLLWTIRISVGQTGLAGGRTGLAGLTGSSMPDCPEKHFSGP